MGSALHYRIDFLRMPDLPVVIRDGINFGLDQELDSH